MAKMERAWRWGGMRIRYASGEVAVSGLLRHDANVLAEAVEAARVGWWRRTFAAQS